MPVFDLKSTEKQVLINAITSTSAGAGDSEGTEQAFPSVHKQRAILLVIIGLQFCSICGETVIYPFFTKVALDRGLTPLQMGLVFSSFDLSRFVSSAIYGSMVCLFFLFFLYLLYY